MELHGADFLPVFLVNFIISVSNFIGVSCLVSNIWFFVDGNARATSKKIYMDTNHKQMKRRNGVGGICSIHIR